MPSPIGLNLYLDLEGGVTPKLTENVWSHLFATYLSGQVDRAHGRFEGFPIAANVDLRVDKQQAKWWNPWIERSPHAPSGSGSNGNDLSTAKVTSELSQPVAPVRHLKPLPISTPSPAAVRRPIVIPTGPPSALSITTFSHPCSAQSFSPATPHNDPMRWPYPHSPQNVSFASPIESVATTWGPPSALDLASQLDPLDSPNHVFTPDIAARGVHTAPTSPILASPVIDFSIPIYFSPPDTSTLNTPSEDVILQEEDSGVRQGAWEFVWPFHPSEHLPSGNRPMQTKLTPTDSPAQPIEVRSLAGTTGKRDGEFKLASPPFARNQNLGGSASSLQSSIEPSPETSPIAAEFLSGIKWSPAISKVEKSQHGSEASVSSVTTLVSQDIDFGKVAISDNKVVLEHRPQLGLKSSSPGPRTRNIPVETYSRKAAIIEGSIRAIISASAGYPFFELYPPLRPKAVCILLMSFEYPHIALYPNHSNDPSASISYPSLIIYPPIIPPEVPILLARFKYPLFELYPSTARQAPVRRAIG